MNRVVDKQDEGRSALFLIIGVVSMLLVAGGLAWWGVQKRQSQENEVSELETVTNSLGMKFVKIPAGSFIMGGAGYGPLREVVVAPFYISTVEVTQAQWMAVMGFNPSEFPDPRRPVEQVSWFEVQSFLEELNRLEGTNRYRLPSEAEWEYAARAGSQTDYFFGDEQGQLFRFAWFASNKGTRPVAGKGPNLWGLYDMYGNVWEWVQDCWHDDYTGAPADSRVWGDGDYIRRVLRGGSWNNRADYLRSAVRGSSLAAEDDYNTGFRVVLNP